MALQEKLIDSLGSFATKFNSYRYIMAIKASFITLMPVIIVGAFSVLISNMVLDPKNGLASFQSLSFLAALKPITSAINYATLNFLNIGAVFLIGIELGRINGIRTLFPGLLAVICFICVTPTTVEMLVDGQMHVVKDVLLRQFSDTRSLFLGMFIAILSVEIYCWLETREAEDQDAGHRAAQRLCLILRPDPGDHHHYRDCHLRLYFPPADRHVSL